jgi:hypothetical protein
MNRKLFTSLCLIAFAIAGVAGQTPTEPEGGILLTMSHSVIAGGGGYSQWTQPDLQSNNSVTVPNFEVEGTIGQAVAGTTSTGGPYSVHGGFWFGNPLQPTAAHASITGSVTGFESRGSAGSRIRVQLTKLSNGEVLTTRVNQFGYYVFNDLEISEFYQVRVVSESMTFEPESMIVRLLDNVTEVNFTAHPIQ